MSFSGSLLSGGNYYGTPFNGAGLIRDAGDVIPANAIRDRFEAVIRDRADSIIETRG